MGHFGIPADYDVEQRQAALGKHVKYVNNKGFVPNFKELWSAPWSYDLHAKLDDVRRGIGMGQGGWGRYLNYYNISNKI